MRSKALIFALLALMLTACGNTDNAGNSNDVKSAELSLQASAETQKQTETSAENEEPAEECMAGASAVNIYGDKMQGLIPDGNEFYGFVSSAMENGEICDTVYDPKTLTAHFKWESRKGSLSCCYDNVIGWNEDGTVKYYQLDKSDYEYIRDTISLYSSMNVVFGGEDLTVSERRTDTSFCEQIAENTPKAHRELRYYYGDDRTQRCYDIEINDTYIYYTQMDYVQTDAVIDGEKLAQSENFYEFFTDGEKSYSRPDQTDVYYPAYTFDGDTELILMTDILSSGTQYCYSMDITSGGNEYTAEIRQAEGQIYYVLIKDDEIFAVCEYDEGVGMKIMTSLQIMDPSPEEIDEAIAHAEEHLDSEATKENPSTDRGEWIKADTEKYGLFDLMQPIEKGEDCEPTGVVEEWRDYISSGNPYTLEYRWTGALRNEYRISSTDGTNYYCRHDMELHEAGHDNLGSEEWCVDGRLFQTTYYLDEIDSKQVIEYPLSEYAKLSSDLLFENEKYNEEYGGKCERAYKVTIGGEEYVCEEWSLYLGRLWKVYIKDGNIVAWEGDFYNEETFNTVIRLEKQGDSELIRIPENSSEYVSND